MFFLKFLCLKINEIRCCVFYCKFVGITTGLISLFRLISKRNPKETWIGEIPT